MPQCSGWWCYWQAGAARIVTAREQWCKTAGQEHYGQSTPAIGAYGTVYVGFGTHFYALKPDGSLRWDREFPDATNINLAPALGADGTVYFSVFEANLSPNNLLIAANPDGSTKWTYGPVDLGFESPPTVDGAGTIYVGVLGALHAVNPDGTLKWTFDQPDSYVNNMSIGENGSLYVTDYAGYIYAVGPGAG